jgi:hypothetical protein
VGRRFVKAIINGVFLFTTTFRRRIMKMMGDGRGEMEKFKIQNDGMLRNKIQKRFGARRAVQSKSIGSTIPGSRDHARSIASYKWLQENYTTYEDSYLVRDMLGFPSRRTSVHFSPPWSNLVFEFFLAATTLHQSALWYISHVALTQMDFRNSKYSSPLLNFI